MLKSAHMKENTPLADIRILVVDDNRLNLKLSQPLLESCGALYDGALGGAAALEICREKSFDLILMDVEMPGMDGFETTIAIKQLATYQQTNPPVIAYTSCSYETVKERMELAGMHGYISKSFSADEVIAAILDALSIGRTLS